MPEKLNRTANENPISHKINYEPQGFYQNR